MLKKLIQIFCQVLLPVFIFFLVSGYFLQSPRVVFAQESEFVLPHTGYISSYFSSYHPGIDLATDLGTAIHPIAKGVVEDILYDRFDYGNHVIVNHNNGYKSLYGHMSKIFVKRDQEVDLSTVLGSVGLTGRTSGPHTHLEITKDGNFINPLAVLPKNLQLPTLSSALSVGGPQPQQPQETQLTKTLKPDFSF